MAQIEYVDLGEQELQFPNFKMKSLLLNHPGNCLGYRLEWRNLSLCYVTDNEIFPRTSKLFSPRQYERLVNFVASCDLLITDSTYHDEEYRTKIGWGHSPVSRVVDLATDARVKTVALFHHDPDQDDEKIDLKLDLAKKQLRSQCGGTEVIAPTSESSFQIDDLDSTKADEKKSA